VPQSLAKNLIHLVFSSRNRESPLAEAVREPLCAYAAGVLRDLDSPAIAANAWRDYVHVLFSLSKNLALSQVVMEIKRATSKWLKTNGVEFANFHRQAGYGAFSIGQSGVAEAIAYIADQPKHHRRKSFEEELRTLLRCYELEFDERYLWD
jgi:REP-associated tyrosine transposase